jgi:hypothetical protein
LGGSFGRSAGVWRGADLGTRALAHDDELTTHGSHCRTGQLLGARLAALGIHDGQEA